MNDIVKLPTCDDIKSDYCISDFLQAINEVYQHFHAPPFEQDCSQLCDALEMYAKHMRFYDE